MAAANASLGDLRTWTHHVLGFSSATTIPPMLRDHPHLHVALTRRTNGQSLGTFQKKPWTFRKTRGILGAPDWKILSQELTMCALNALRNPCRPAGYNFTAVNQVLKWSCDCKILQYQIWWKFVMFWPCYMRSDACRDRRTEWFVMGVWQGCGRAW